MRFAFSNTFSGRVIRQGHYRIAVVNGFFVSYSHSDTMRNVSGSVLNNPVTRASQNGEGGPRIEPGGKAVRSLSLSSDYAKTWLQRVMYASTERTVVIEHGKAVLCSSIHQRVITH